MPTYSQQSVSPYSPRQLFDLVMDINAYPQFLPWVTSATIIHQTPEETIAELDVQFKHLHQHYTSRVTPSPPNGGHAPCGILVQAIDGPFHHLDNRWNFTPLEDNTTQVVFHIDFAFKSRMLNSLLGIVFGRAVHDMHSAFTQRAEQLYG